MFLILRHLVAAKFIFVVHIILSGLTFLTCLPAQERVLAEKALRDAGNRAGQVAIVTGANSGIGLEMSRQLASIGYKVILGCRSEKNAQDAMGTLFTCILSFEANFAS